MTATAWRYVIALGSNVPHPHHGAPRKVLAAALAALDAAPLRLIAAAPVIDSTPLGPSRRRYANGAAVVETTLGPRALLAQLQAIEATFGRNRRIRRWGARVLDLDIALWSGGLWHDRHLAIPHRELARRAFVLHPACTIAADWRCPPGPLRIRHLFARLTRTRPMPKAAPACTGTGPIAQSVEQLTFNQ